MKTYFLKLINKTEVAPKTWEYEFEKDKNFNFLAGQHVGVYVPKLLSADPMGSVRLFSICSTPNEETIKILFREGRSGYKQSLQTVEVGQMLEIEGPYGRFVLKENQNEHAVFITGGVGIAPVIGILKSVLGKKKTPPLTLFFCNQTPQSAPYLEELLSLAKKHKAFEMIYSFTRHKESYLEGLSGRITTSVLQKHLPKINSSRFYVVGLPEMVNGVYEELIGLGVEEENIKMEHFAGY